MRELVFFLEEFSAQAMLEGFLPKFVPRSISIRYIVFDGKQDLEKQLVRRLRGYRNKEADFVVIRDQDSGDCQMIKARLEKLCIDAGCPKTVVRIACRELESFYLADLLAVEKGLGITGIARHQGSKKFRAPDRLGSPSQELKVLTKGRYQKISGSRAIGHHLDPANSRSHSFTVLVEAVRRMAAQNCA